MKSALSLINVSSVALGGALGASSRYACSILMVRLLGNAFPYGTLLVNVLGSACMGVIATFLAYKGNSMHPLALMIMVGFLGAFTTFSSFSLDTLNLFLNAEAGLALVNVLLNTVLCLVFVTLGMMLTKFFVG